MFNTELIKPRGPWRTAEQVKIATLWLVQSAAVHEACGDWSVVGESSADGARPARVTDTDQAVTGVPERGGIDPVSPHCSMSYSAGIIL